MLPPDSYYAGLIDGEAYVSIQKKRPLDRAKPLIVICMTHLEVLELCQKRFGGKLYPKKPHKGTKPHHKPAWYWAVTGSTAKLAACSVLPFAVVKRFELAELVLWEPIDICKYITVGHETYSMAEWSRRNGISYRTIQARIQSGWTEQNAVTIPATAGKPNKAQSRKYRGLS